MSVKLRYCCESMQTNIRLDAHSGFPSGIVSQSMIDLKAKVGKAKVYERIAYRADRGRTKPIMILNWCPFCKTRLNKALYDKIFPRKKKAGSR